MYFKASKNNSEILIHILSANENPQDKAKEWAARGRAVLYSLEKHDKNSVLKFNKGLKKIFICDGIWDIKSRKRLEDAGWQTCSLTELPEILKDIERKL